MPLQRKGKYINKTSQNNWFICIRKYTKHDIIKIINTLISKSKYTLQIQNLVMDLRDHYFSEMRGFSTYICLRHAVSEIIKVQWIIFACKLKLSCKFNATFLLCFPSALSQMLLCFLHDINNKMFHKTKL